MPTVGVVRRTRKAGLLLHAPRFNFFPFSGGRQYSAGRQVGYF